MKTLKIENLDLHASDMHGHSFNCKKYFEKVYNVECSCFNLEESFDVSIIDVLFKKFEFIYHSTFSLTLEGIKKEFTSKNIFNYLSFKKKPNFLFKHKEYIILANIVDKNDEEGIQNNYDDDDIVVVTGSSEEVKRLKKNINDSNSKVYITIYYSSDKLFESMKDDFSFLEKYIISEKNKDFISILIKNQYGDYNFEPLDIKVPTIDLKLNYGKKFPEIFKKTVSKLKNNNKGLYMFHGDPGTGKSSFIKYLTTVIDKEFIFIPSNFIDKFISDPDIFSILLRRKKSVIILEDAEKILISRETDDNQFISTLLNLSDGILSDMLEVSVILTYNCDETKIDKALKRKGRTMVDYRFGKLSVEESKLLAESLNFTEEQVKDIKEPMSLSEIYNMNDENKFYEDESNKKRVIGFGN
jgi:ATPase family associated with various cellular activities (AAA)